MREIKFRVWDCHTKEMAGPKGLRIDFDNGVIDHIEFKFSDYGSWGNATHPLDQDRYKVMQFTGLHDKNGFQDIYEGDIIDETGNVRGNIYENTEMDSRPTNLIIQDFGGRDWGSTYATAISRGCTDAQ